MGGAKREARGCNRLMGKDIQWGCGLAGSRLHFNARGRVSGVVRNGWREEVGEDIGVGALGFVIGGLARGFSPGAKTHVR